jgi:flagellar hook-associated protein 1 FlgK
VSVGSTFAGIHGAYSGLTAAQMQLNVTGQNIENASSTGYVRQRAEQQAVGAPAKVGLSGIGMQAGQGTTITGISNLSNVFLDTQVRSAAASSGYATSRASGYTTVEAALGEPKDTAISSQLQKFWAAWSDVSNQPGTDAPVGSLLAQAQTVVAQVADKYQAMQAGWAGTRTSVTTQADQLNALTKQVGDLNSLIRSTVATGNNANEMVNQRAAVVQQISALTGGTVTQNADSTISIAIGGSNIVDGTLVRQVAVVGANTLEDASSSPVQLVWADKPSVPLSLPSGSIAGDLTVLSAANPAGTGGPYAEAAAQLNALATNLATQVNQVASTGVTPTGQTGLNFFAQSATGPAALGLSVIPTSGAQVPTGAAGAGTNDGSVADKISHLGATSTSPDASWATFVVTLGVQSQVSGQQQTLTTSSLATAVTSQQSQEGVDLDEESVNLLQAQHAYQGAARVLTAMDQLLDQLINHTGTVGMA